MKKFSKVLTVGLATIFGSIVNVSAKEMTLNNLDSIIPEGESYVFVIGDYLFTNDAYSGITALDYAFAIHTIDPDANGGLTYYGLLKKDGEWTVDYAFLSGNAMPPQFTVDYVDNVLLPKDDPHSLLEYYVEDLGKELNNYLNVNEIVNNNDILNQAQSVYDHAIEAEATPEDALKAAKEYITNEIGNALKSKLATDLANTYNEGKVAEDGKALDSADYATYSAVLAEGSEATIDEMIEAYNNALNARYVLADVIEQNKSVIDAYVESLKKDVLEHADETYYNAVKTTIDAVKANIDAAQNKTEVLNATENGKNAIKEDLKTKVLAYLEDVYTTNYDELETDTVLVMTEGQYNDYVAKITSAETVDSIISLYEEVVSARTEMSKEDYDAVNAHIEEMIAKFKTYANDVEVTEDIKNAIESKIKNATTVDAVDEAYEAAVKELALAALESYNGGAANYTQKESEYTAALGSGKSAIEAISVTEGYEEAVKSALENAISAIDEIDDDTSLAQAKVVADLEAYVKSLQDNGALTSYLPEGLENAADNLQAAITDLTTAEDVQDAYEKAVEEIVSGVRTKVVAELDKYKDEKAVSEKIMPADDYEKLFEALNTSNDPVEIVETYTNATTEENEEYVLISKTAYDAKNAIEKANEVVAAKDDDYTIDVTDVDGSANRYHNVPEYKAAKDAYEAAIKVIEDSFGTSSEKSATDVQQALSAFNTALKGIDSDLQCEIHNAVDGDYTDLYNSLVEKGKFDENGEKIGSYGTTQKKTLDTVFSQQKPQVRAAKDMESLKSLYEAAVEALMAVKTDEEVFNDAMTAKLNELDAYYNELITSEEKHYEINGAELLEVYNTQRNTISSFEFEDESTASQFDSLYTTAKAALDAIEDDETVIAARTSTKSTVESTISSLTESIGEKAGTSETAKEIVKSIFESLKTDILAEIDTVTGTSALSGYDETYVRSKAKPVFKEEFLAALEVLYNAGKMNTDGKVLKLVDYTTAKNAIDTDETNMGSMVRAYVTAEQALINFEGEEGLKETLVGELTTTLSGLTANIATENTSFKTKTVKDMEGIADIIATASTDEFASEVTNEAELVKLISDLKRSILDKFIEIIETEINGYRDNYDAEYYIAGSYINTTYEVAVKNAVSAYQTGEELDTALKAIATAYDTMMNQATKKGA